MNYFVRRTIKLRLRYFHCERMYYTVLLKRKGSRPLHSSLLRHFFFLTRHGLRAIVLEYSIIIYIFYHFVLFSFSWEQYIFFPSFIYLNGLGFFMWKLYEGRGCFVLLGCHFFFLFFAVGKQSKQKINYLLVLFSLVIFCPILSFRMLHCDCVYFKAFSVD